MSTNKNTLTALLDILSQLKVIWQRISEVGVYPDVSENEIRRIRLLNRMNAIVLVMIVSSTIIDFRGTLNESPTLLLFNIISTIVPVTILLYVYFLVRKRRHFVAKTLWFTFMFFLALIPTYLTMNTAARVETFFIITIPLLALLLYEDRRVALGTLIFTLFAYFLIVWLDPSPVIVFPANENYLVLTFTSITVFLLTYQLNSVNKKFENKLSEQKSAIEHQKNELHIKNKEILDSITYALRIQNAMLPLLSAIQAALPHSFIFYKPKDIVAGDFYWFHKVLHSRKDAGWDVLIAAADCTGHGVPGALTSMICSEKLNEAVKHSTDPGIILSLVNQTLKVSLKQTDSKDSTRDGMDIALCSVDLNMGIVKYAGANRPIWIIRKNSKEIEEIKATKTAIGGDTPTDQIFGTRIIQLRQGDTFYISSDGYADQDGGDKGRRIMTKPFKQILINIQDKSMTEQKEYLEEFAEKWRGAREQLDDILVIGVRI